MKAGLLEYKKEHMQKGIISKRLCFLGQEGKKYWFVHVTGEDSTVCSGRFWMSEDQIETLITEL